MKKALTVILTSLSLLLFTAGINFYMNADVVALTRHVVTGLLIFDGLLYIGLNLLKDNSRLIIRIGWIGLVLANILLTVMDNVGLWDMVVILANAAALFLYFKLYRVKFK